MLKRSGPLTDVTGRTTASVLCLDASLRPPPSPFYGAISKQGFRLSRIFQYDGKPWQLRTVIYKGQHFIAPFCVNTGGVHSKAPILATPLLKKIGAMPPKGLDRAAWENHGRVQVPSPLGELTSIEDWDIVRKRSETLDASYNLVGHGFARFVERVDYAADLVQTRRTTEKEGIEDLIRNCPTDIVKYIRNPHNLKRVQRELRAVLESWDDPRDMDELAKEWATK